MKIEAAKNIIDAQFLKAIYSDVDLDGFHPMRVIQALKSLIGINIEKPSIKLIEWGDNYLNNIKLLPDNHFKYSINKPKETIVLSKLTLALINLPVDLTFINKLSLNFSISLNKFISFK